VRAGRKQVMLVRNLEAVLIGGSDVVWTHAVNRDRYQSVALGRLGVSVSARTRESKARKMDRPGMELSGT
jgi:hypothetical protein